MPSNTQGPEDFGGITVPYEVAMDWLIDRGSRYRLGGDVEMREVQALQMSQPFMVLSTAKAPNGTHGNAGDYIVFFCDFCKMDKSGYPPVAVRSAAWMAEYFVIIDSSEECNIGCRLSSSPTK